jgi:hypothetical protein
MCESDERVRVLGFCVDILHRPQTNADRNSIGLVVLAKLWLTLACLMATPNIPTGSLVAKAAHKPTQILNPFRTWHPETSLSTCFKEWSAVLYKSAPDPVYY